jgi:hypothetical protein
VFSSLLCYNQPFFGNGFKEWKFFGFPRSSRLVKAGHAELLFVT